LLAYLQLVDNPSFNPALMRAVNIPGRGIGEKVGMARYKSICSYFARQTMLEISTRAEKAHVSQLRIIEGICDGRLPDIKIPAKRKFVPFVKIIRTLRNLAEKVALITDFSSHSSNAHHQRTSPPNLIRRLVELLEYQDHLRKTQPDWESRWENVQELMTFASEVEVGSANEQNDQETSAGDDPKSVILSDI
jgi:DNA helicase-2/ATP-dependent DNA helicase PcrA